jgi:serine/threonine protein kinase
MTGEPNTAPPEAGLDSIVGQVADDFLRRQQAGERPDPEEYAARHPAAAPLIRNVLRSLRLVESAGGSGGPPPEGGPDEAALGLLGDFRIVREIGRGGMGVVYEAEQISLGRRVALKVLPYAATMDAKQLQRFRNEAKAAASLHHEHIVPVYAVGCERGVHYYAMQFIDGTTLADVIGGRAGGAASPLTAAYAPLPSPPTGRGQKDTALVAALSTERGPKGRAYHRSVAGLIAETADALEHAHSVGIVHRDVKPGNLIVDTNGKVWVADFGLARFGPDAGLTMSGDLLGTLRYMAPEQALSHHGLVDHRADVYALGATLYELLTGRPAVDASERAEVLRKIAFEDPTAPRKLDKAIPTELETIALKCLAKNPAERYATAGELADDLRRWLGDQTIKAKPPSLRQKAAKWGRRHSGIVAASIVGLILAAAAATVSTVVVYREKQRTQRAFDQARKALDELTTNVMQDWVRRQEHSKQYEDFLRRAVDHYEGFATQAGDDEATRAGVAAIYHRLSNIRSMLRQWPEMRAASERSRTLFEGLAADFPKNVTYRHYWAANVHNIGTTYDRTGSLREAEPLYRQAVALKMQNVADHPDSVWHRRDQAHTLNALAHLLWRTGRPAEAAQFHRSAIVLREEEAAEDATPGKMLATTAAASVAGGQQFFVLPESGSPRERLAHQCNGLAGCLAATGQKAEAERCYRRVLEISEQLIADYPDELRCLDLHSHSLSWLAGFLRTEKQYAEAEQLYRRRLKIAEELAAAPPAAIGRARHQEWVQTAAVSQSELASLFHELRRLPEAIALQEQVLERRKAALGPDHPDTLSSAQDLAAIYLDAGKLDQADRLLRDLLHRQRQQDNPKPAATGFVLAMLGWNLLAQQRYVEAEAILKECIAIREEKVPDGWHRFNALSMLGGALLGQGKYADAEQLLVQGYEGMKRREADIPQGAKGRLAEAVERLARLYDATGRADDARAWRAKLPAGARPDP